MAIYLDTNILPQPPRTHLDSPGLGALRALSAKTSTSLILPALVVEESVSARRRYVQDLVEGANAQLSDLRKLSSDVDLLDTSISDREADSWRRAILDRFVVLPMSTQAALEALEREAHRRRPARNGTGSRDAAIWLTVCEHHAASEEESFFVSDNRKDFADQSGHGLHPELMNDVERSPHALHYCRSVSDVVRLLAEPSARGVTQAELAESGAAHSAVVGALEQIVGGSLKPMVVDSGAVGRPYLAGRATVELVNSWGRESFGIGTLDVTVLSTRWKWAGAVGVLMRHTGGGFSEHTSESSGTLLVQLMATSTAGALDGVEVLEVVPGG